MQKNDLIPLPEGNDIRFFAMHINVLLLEPVILAALVKS